MKETQTKTHISRVAKVDLEKRLDDALFALHGQRFRDYRKEYNDVLSSDDEDYMPERPITVGIELLNKCNFKCIMCTTPKSMAPKIVLDMAVIERAMSEAKKLGVPSLMFGMGEEPLLHKGFLDVLDLAKKAEIMDIFLFTNGVLLTEKIARALIDSPISRVYVSLDAATPETFENIRGKNELLHIEENIHRLLKIRDEVGSKLPIVRVSFCAQPDNFHEREAFARKWEDVVDHVDYQEVRDYSAFDHLAQLSDEACFAASEERRSDVRCQQPWEKLTIWSNGAVTPCCTFHGKYLVVGKIHEQTMDEIWNGAKINSVRKQLQGGPINPVCNSCLESRTYANKN